MLITRTVSQTIDLQDLTRDDIKQLIAEAYRQAGLPRAQDFRPMGDDEPTGEYLAALRDWSAVLSYEYSPRVIVWPFLAALLFDSAEGYGRVSEVDTAYEYEVGGEITQDGEFVNA